jgi:hypothetical protein
MSDDRERPMDAGDAVREGVRSITGILGALKEAIEETFSDLKPTGPADSGNAEEEGARSTFQRAQETVDEVRDRFDFITRREFDTLRAAVDELRSRIEAMSGPGAATTAGPQAGAAPKDAPDDGPAGESGNSRPAGSKFRFEVE